MRTAPTPPTIHITAVHQAKVANPAIGETTDSGLTRSLSKQQSAAQTLSNCEPYREFIQESLGRGRNAMAIWQDPVTDYGFPHSYQSVKRFVNKLCPPELKPAREIGRASCRERA